MEQADICGDTTELRGSDSIVTEYWYRTLGTRKLWC